MLNFGFVKTLEKGKKSLSSAPFQASSVVVVVLLSFIGLYWSIDEYSKYHNNLEYIQKKYLEDSQKRLQDETRSIVEFISYRELQVGKEIEQELRDKVQIAYTTASHLYGLHNGSMMNNEQLQSAIVESLRPMRWDMGKGYFFITDTGTNTIVLHAAHPELEGRSIDSLGDQAKAYQAFAKITEMRGAGFYRYLTTKPGTGNELFSKLSFVKEFQPYNWIMGNGIYLDEITLRTQNTVISRMSEIEFGDNGYFFCVDAGGHTIVDFDKLRVGRHVDQLQDNKNKSYGNEILKIGTNGIKNGFYSYETLDATGNTVLRLSHIVNYDPWKWVIVASVELSGMQQAINFEMEHYQNRLIQGAILYLLLAFFTVGIIFLIASHHSNKIKEGLEIFTDFFKDAAEKKISVEKRAFGYQEFDVLGQYANKMVEDREEKDKLIQSNEMRLDTLLGLARMSGHDSKKLAVFTIERLLKILGSEYGYIALYEKESNIINVLSVQGPKCDPELASFPLSTTGISFPAKTYRSGKTIIDNYPTPDVITGVYPQDVTICNYLDVPYQDGSSITLIAGVCNKKGFYTEADSRQVILLLEGVWRMLLKTQAEKEMQDLRVLLRTIYDSMPSALVVVDKDCRIMLWNAEASSCTGIDNDNVKKKPLIDFFPRLRTFQHAVLDVIKTNIPFIKRNVPFEQDGMTKYETITVYPLGSEGYTGAVIRLDDVTEKVQIEGLMVQSEKMLSVGGLAAGMAHEINNPLAGIMQNLQVVRNRLSGEFTKNQKVADECHLTIENLNQYIERRGINELLNSIAESSDRAAKLVKNMLSFSRKGNAMYSFEDICDIVESAVNLALSNFDIRQKVDVDKVEICREFAQDLPMISCERVNIQQVLFNIIVNGLYALLSSSEIRQQPKIILRVYQDGKWMVVDIEDNGSGMDEQTAKRVFEPFYTTKPVDVGTGLGLSISYFIVKEQHEGSLEVRSALGEGTVFSVRLPLQRQTTISLNSNEQNG